MLTERALAIGDAALDRPLDTAIAVTRLARWGRAAARDRLNGTAGTLAAVIRAACGSGEDIGAAPDPVRRAVAWQLGQPRAGSPALFGAVEPTPPPRIDRLDLNSLSDRAVSRPWPGSPEALARVLGQATGAAADRRTLATDVLTQLIADGRLTSGELGAALAGTDSWQGSGAGRLVEAPTRTAGSSPLHRAVVRRSLAASATAWHGLAARPLCALLSLLDQLCAADGFGLADQATRAVLTPLGAGRTKTAGLIRNVLSHPTTTPGRDWPDAAAALAARLERVR